MLHSMHQARIENHRQNTSVSFWPNMAIIVNNSHLLKSIPAASLCSQYNHINAPFKPPMAQRPTSFCPSKKRYTQKNKAISLTLQEQRPRLGVRCYALQQCKRIAHPVRGMSCERWRLQHRINRDDLLQESCHGSETVP